MDFDNTFALLIAGSRTFIDYDIFKKITGTILETHQNKHILIIEGGAKGADALAKQYAYEYGYELKEIPADWDKHGKSAGYIRNKKMHQYLNQFKNKEVLCFWDGKSKGTAHNFDLAKEFDHELTIFRTDIYELKKKELENKDYF